VGGSLGLSICHPSPKIPARFAAFLPSRGFCCLIASVEVLAHHDAPGKTSSCRCWTNFWQGMAVGLARVTDRVPIVTTPPSHVW